MLLILARTIKNCINKVRRKRLHYIMKCGPMKKNLLTTRKSSEDTDLKITLASNISNKSNISIHLVVRFEGTINTDQASKLCGRVHRG